jgi:hypothetical protein
MEERDRLAAENERIAAERDRLAESLESVTREGDQARTAVRRLNEELRGAWLLHRPPELLTWQRATVQTVQQVDDSDLVRRIVAAYRAASQTNFGSLGSFWLTSYAESKQPVHDALMREDHEEITRILRAPGLSTLFYGFESLISPGIYPSNPTDFWDCAAPYDTLRCLAEALGVHRLENPEQRYYGGAVTSTNPSADQILADLEGRLGFAIDIPNPFIGETGLATSRGVMTYRVIQALYQAWRIARLTEGVSSSRILEIGGGLGRTAYYAWRSGVRDYTIIDLPMTGVAQGYFLGRTLGEDSVCLFGEERSGIRVLPPVAFLDATDRFDLAINVDSLTEMAAETAEAYCRAIKARAGLFLSINHETNPFTVCQTCANVGMPVIGRTPYWLRRGYVEEVFNCAP